MSILDKIIENKKREVFTKKIAEPIAALETKPYFLRKTYSLVDQIRQSESPAIISEFKRKSPSKGVINDWSTIEEVTHDYIKAGISGLSILTDQDYFGGSINDLQTVRGHLNCPVLRKDFMIDEYQIIEAKAMGADVILLIAAALNTRELTALGALAQSLGLEVLLEVHNQSELEKSLNPHIDLLGVNNRNLRTFETKVGVSKSLAAQIPNDFVKVSESGIDDPQVVIDLMGYGYQGFLIGECFMKTLDPGKHCFEFVKSLKSLMDET
ncbi:MAG: indole-3-glycerol phosphate synthase [Flammeovirgaceae bacterium]|nr:indole-3-glycerol phosphate synthase [Flammeovirgaceae bacterium]|tara:strand:- start:926 stop:1729 length:804 start_codon:yes stop_codon:yes gene_type:complete